MSLFDHHRRLLSPDIWHKDEMSPTNKVKAQLHDQVDRRFPRASKVLFVGDLVGHYYDPESPLDVLLLVPKEVVDSYRKEAQFVSGYKLRGSDHAVNFHFLDESLNTAVLADRFGTLYDVVSGDWVGKRVADLSELARPEAILQRIRWRLYKTKASEEPYPYRWDVAREAFARLGEEDREFIVSELQQIVARLQSNISNVVKTYNRAEVWTAASTLNELLAEDADEDDVLDLVKEHNVPPSVLTAIYNKYRYQHVLELLQEDDERLQQEKAMAESESGPKLQMITSGVEAPDELVYRNAVYHKTAGGASKFMWDRVNALVNLVVVNNGGYGNAVDVVYKIFDKILSGSRYMNTGPRRRKVVLRLYKKYYRHMDVD